MTRRGGAPALELLAMLLFARAVTAIGTLLLVGERRRTRLALRGVYFDGQPHAAAVIPLDAQEDVAAFADVRGQLEAYLEGERVVFDVPLAPLGTPFQHAVWKALAAIPYGTTTTYTAMASAIGRPRAVRAVGAANGKNPLSIVVPCHRVIGRDGTLTGYAGGVARKRRLLALERSALARP